MENAFKFVVMGSGNITGTYIRAVQHLPGIEIVGIVSRSGRRPAAVPEGSPIMVAPSLDELSCAYDAVILATPNGLHHAGASEAAARGKHVLSEKSLDVTEEAMDTMIRACRDHGVKLGVMYQRRMSPDNIAVKDLLAAGALGRVYAADLYVKYYRDQAYYDSAPYRGSRDLDGGGPFMQQGSHNIDIYCWFFGKPEKVVSVLDTLAHRMESEDHGVALLRYADGMIGSITCSTLAAPGFPARLEIHAAKGSVIMENDAITTWAVTGVPNPSRAGKMKVHSGAASAAVSDTAGHEAIIRDFVAAVNEGRDPVVTGESARVATELVLEIYRQRL